MDIRHDAFFALVMVESRLVRMFDQLNTEIGEEALADISQAELIELTQDRGQGYNVYIFEKNQTLKAICQNDKSLMLILRHICGVLTGRQKTCWQWMRRKATGFSILKALLPSSRPKRCCWATRKNRAALTSNRLITRQLQR